MKKLIFVLILLFSIDITHRLFLLLPFTWFKSEVKDTVVEPVVQDDLLDKSKESILKWLQDVRATFEVEKRQIGVLFYRKVNGKWRWHENGNDDYHPKYEGKIENGKPNGQGTETFPDGDKYVGEFKDGLLNGQGTYTFHDGGKYEGGWKDSKKHGQGTQTYGKGKWEGDKYIGEYRDGKRHGQGIYTYGKGKWNGDKYEGEYKDGKFHGQGTYTSSNGNKYVGGWKDGMRHGLGKGEWGEDKYEGIWKDDKKHGRGTFTWSSGDEALGEWRDGNPWNVDYFDNKGKFLGRFLDGVKDVEKKKEGVLFGRIVNGNPEWYKDGYNNDERYVGEIENEKPNGQGTLTLPDGRKFVGKFKDGKMDGQGTFTFPDRTKGVGYFRGTKPWNVTKYDKEGTILGKYVNGKWIKN